MLKTIRVAALVVALALPVAGAVPGQVDFQGLLLDSGGQKVNGAVDLDFALFDAPSGGSALWTESHDDVQVSDGVYGVTLGATTPLDGSVLAAGDVFLEIVVDGETLTPRRQLLAVPYAVRAQTADDAENVGGVGAAFYGEIVQHFPFDGGDPPNDDPTEGTVDVDGDGLANFIDPDNDADGPSDVAELGQGSDINLVTPTITGFSAATSLNTAPLTVVVSGTNFEVGMSVAFGTDNPVPFNLTPTSFEVSVAPQSASSVNVVVTRANGQGDAAIYHYRGRRVFLSDPVTGNLGGITGADAICSAEAASLSLPGSFEAWLADGTTSPAARFLQDGAAYQRLDGVRIADSWADLTDGTLDAPIVTGVPSLLVWTGAASDGTPIGGNCANWTSGVAPQQGRLGNAVQSNSQWSGGAGEAFCNTSLAVYCFEQ